MTIQNKIEQQMKEFRKRFFIVPNNIPKKEFESFLSSSQQELIQEVVKMVKKEKISPLELEYNENTYNHGYNNALSDIITELEKITQKHI